MSEEIKKIRKQFTRKVWLASRASSHSKHDTWLDVAEKTVGQAEYEKLWKIALQELS